MSFELWLAYVIAAGILIAIPGPTNFMVIGYGLRAGTKAAITTVFGVIPGVTCTMVLSFLGLGAVLATSATLFTLMKWAGALYLIYLGIQQWRSEPEVGATHGADEASSNGKIIAHAFIITFLNPKGIVFFVAFLPQFMTSDAPALPQMLILVATFNALTIPINTAYALLAGTLRQTIHNRRTLRQLNRIGGGMLIGAGLMTASLKRV
jgi:threonine/homoserine/homoserine lactone efflux protein